METISLFFCKIVAKYCYWERQKINQKGPGFFKKVCKNINSEMLISTRDV